MSATSTRRGPATTLETIVLWAALALVTGGAGVVWLATRLAPVVGGGARPLPDNPATLIVQLISGEISWQRADSIAVGIVLACAAGLGVGGRACFRRLTRAPAVDRAARRLARDGDISRLRRKAALASAQRLGADDIGPGLPLGTAVDGGGELFSSWEDVTVDIWGPRTGKTTARAIPALLAAPGAALVTSNKRDIVDATRDPRADRGPVWVFDPQQIVEEPVTWWWNPLDYVADEAKARVLADLFAAGSRPSDARTDAYFDSAAKDLLAGLLLAAAVADRPITDVYRWLCDPSNDEPAELLAADHPLIADAVRAAVLAPDKQRAGVFATAQQSVTFLTNRAALAWITPPRAAHKRFHPDELIASGGTLYAISKEGRGTLGPLVAALTVAVTEAAEAVARRHRGGRLPVPMVAVLDEAANVCRWPDLPDLYSHYGSRGIVIMTILQSWSQGEAVWGKEGMRKLWSAANIRVYGGGVAEVAFLSDLAQLGGEYHRQERSRTDARGGSSSTHSVRSDKVLDVADLAAMPRGRALVLPSGGKPVLIRTRPWMTGPDAARIRESLRRHEPGDDSTARGAARSGRR